MKKLAKFLVVTIAILSVVFVTGCNKNNYSKKLIISTSFPGYDAARAITKNSKNVEVKMLLKPGSETHTYEPTPQDIINIKNSDIFIYVGGESDEWIKNILNDIDTEKTKIIRLVDLVSTVKEDIVEGMESHEDDGEDAEDEEDDEHVWTSPINEVTIVDKLKDSIINIDESNSELYLNNARNYIDDINVIDNDIREIVSSSKRKVLVFGDRFPLRYFVDEYGLSYYAAFPGCSEQTEASAKTISFLVNKINENKIPVIFHIELSSGNIANAIAGETEAKVLEFNSAHNLSESDFNKGVTYVDLMKRNIDVLKEALN